MRAAAIDAEHGFYIRRSQTATIELDGVELAPGEHRVSLALGLGGVDQPALRRVAQGHLKSDESLRVT